MKYQRTQIYLDPGEHRELVREAAGQGTSLAGLVRQIVTSHLRGRSTVHVPKGFDAIIGVVSEGEPTDVALEQKKYRAEALEARYQRKMGLPDRRRSTRRPKR